MSLIKLDLKKKLACGVFLVHAAEQPYFAASMLQEEFFIMVSVSQWRNQISAFQKTEPCFFYYCEKIHYLRWSVPYFIHFLYSHALFFLYFERLKL